MTTTELPLCGYTLLRTEHPKLFILEAKPGNTFASRGIIPVNNLDIFTYMNSKFVYIEKHVKQQMTSLYNNVILQKCELERQVITNALSFATLQPDEFAYRLMKGPGYMAVTTGEAVQIIKCIPVEVMVRKTEECYAELPISVRNHSFFLTPKSRIITKIGNERECSLELPIFLLRKSIIRKKSRKGHKQPKCLCFLQDAQTRHIRFKNVPALET